MLLAPKDLPGRHFDGDNVRSKLPLAPMGCGLWSNISCVGATGGRRKRIEEPSIADVLASWWPDWAYASVIAVPQLFIDVHLPRLRLAEVKLFLYFLESTDM